MLKIIFGLFTFGFSLQGQSQEQAQAPIAFSLMTIPVYIEDDRTGPMFEANQQILEALSRKFNVPFIATVAPPLRAQQSFVAGKAQALMPDFCDANVGIPFVHSVPFARIVRHILTPANTPPIKSYAALKGKRVGLVRGYSYEIEGKAGEGIDRIWATSQRQTLRMLNNGRLDAIVASVDEAAQIIKTEGGQMPSVDLDHPVLDRSLCYVFHDNQLGRHLALEVSAQILAMRRDGRMQSYTGLNHIPDYRPAHAEVR